MIKMANILKSTYQASNFKPNSELRELTITLDSDIDISEINSYLPNNGDRFGTMSAEGINYLATESSAVVVCPSYKYMCSFVAEYGTVVNSATGWKNGVWKAFAKIEFIA
jgi:hypothetical protein